MSGFFLFNKKCYIYTMKIFLDDERNPINFVGYDNTWTIARNFEEFNALVLKAFHGLDIIECISFDHDLGKDTPDGYDCVKWLVDQYITIDSALVHSMNPVGAENIFHLLKNWQKYNNQEINVTRVHLELK